MIISGIFAKTTDTIGISLTNNIIKYFRDWSDLSRNYNNKKY